MRSLDAAALPAASATPQGPPPVRALRGEPVERVPVLMRQAGRPFEADELGGRPLADAVADLP